MLSVAFCLFFVSVSASPNDNNFKIQYSEFNVVTMAEHLKKSYKCFSYIDNIVISKERGFWVNIEFDIFSRSLIFTGFRELKKDANEDVVKKKINFLNKEFSEEKYIICFFLSENQKDKNEKRICWRKCLPVPVYVDIREIKELVDFMCVQEKKIITELKQDKLIN